MPRGATYQHVFGQGLGTHEKYEKFKNVFILNYWRAKIETRIEIELLII